MVHTIRNFSIIAHIDHGKTTLTDRMLLKTGTITEREFRERVLDSNPIEQERGITIKLAPVRMEYKDKRNGNSVVLNLIDTPGHVDFSYEVSRSLQAVEGVILLVDATKGIQAQTLSHYYKAKEQNLEIIPVINKIDLTNAEVESVQLTMMEIFDFSEDEFVFVSAKTGEGVDELFEKLIDRVPEAEQNDQGELRALVFNSFYDDHKGVIASVRVVEGVVEAGDEFELMGTSTKCEPQSVGVFRPEMTELKKLTAGEVGYVATGLKDIRKVQVGDTLTTQEDGSKSPLPGYNPPQLMVFMDFYPIDGGEFAELNDAMEKLKLNDAALNYTKTHSPALGNGLRVGFLGILHAEIVQERLEREFGIELIATSPSVKYKLDMTSGKNVVITNPAELPDPSMIQNIYEPITTTKIYLPKDYVGAVMQLAEDHRGSMRDMSYLGNRAQLIYQIPLAEIIVTFFDELKSASSGYASMEYEVTDYAQVDAVKLTILINKEPVEALSQLVVREKAEEVGRRVVKILKDVIPRQLFVIPIQAAIGGKIIARETVSAYRKDVTAKLYGGDATRRKKLLEKQKKGKARRKQFGKVDIPQEAFMAVLKR